MKILVIHGPNLNLLGTREPQVYGTRSLARIDSDLVAYGRERGVEIETFQSNHEGAIIDRIQSAGADEFGAIVLNPGAYTHTSLAIADAIRAVALPVVEVHLSNLFARGAERSGSVTAVACRGLVCGLGHESYRLGIDAVMRLARGRRRPAKAGRAPSRPPRKARSRTPRR
jgi:3-dehydroquinate dehydratase-2